MTHKTISKRLSEASQMLSGTSALSKWPTKLRRWKNPKDFDKAFERLLLGREHALLACKHDRLLVQAIQTVANKWHPEHIPAI
jgi:hypothetical protein